MRIFRCLAWLTFWHKEQIPLAKKINQHNMAVAVSHLEGGSVKLSIAQVKEVVRHHTDLLAQEFKTNPLGVIQLLRARKLK